MPHHAGIVSKGYHALHDPHLNTAARYLGEVPSMPEGADGLETVSDKLSRVGGWADSQSCLYLRGACTAAGDPTCCGAFTGPPCWTAASERSTASSCDPSTPLSIHNIHRSM